MVFGFTGLWINAGVFLFAAAIVGVVGPRLSRAADDVGEITGLGQTLAGALLLGASTSLPGLVVSFQSAIQGQANLAVANAVGGIAAQTLFIAFADIALRGGTIEHEGALADSLMQSAVLIVLLTVLITGMIEARFSLYGSLHPVSIVVVVGVVLGFKTIQRTQKHPSWRARGDDSSADGSSPEGSSSKSDGTGSNSGGETSQSRETVLRRYGTYVILIGIAGYLISSTAGAVISRTGVSQAVMGLTLTAPVTSLPELVTAVSSVRRGVAELGIGDIVGGNAFDTIMVAIADFAYLDGSVYLAVSTAVVFITTVALLMTGILDVGFIRRDRTDVAGIGVESYLIILTYVIGVGVVLGGTLV